MKVRNLTRCALFASVALIIFIVESHIPPIIPVPGFKLGLANVVTLAAMYVLGRKEAFWILTVRIILGNMFSGQLMSMLYSFCGGYLCFGITALLKNRFGSNTVWALGVIGAIFHNIGQTLCAYFFFESGAIFYYGAVLCLAAVVTGIFTGLCAQFTIKYFKEKRL